MSVQMQKTKESVGREFVDMGGSVVTGAGDVKRIQRG